MSGIRDIWLYANNIIRSARQMVNEELLPLNLSSAEGNILIHLWTQSRQFRQEEIVDQLDISKPAVSRALESLEKKGYVVRLKDPSDKRASLVQLTDKARQIGPRLENVYNEIFAVASQRISDSEIRDFINLFGRVSENFSLAQAKKREQGRPE